MGKSTYAQNKASIYRWREKNKNKMNNYEALRQKSKYIPKLFYSFDHVVRQLLNIKSTYFLT